MQSDSWEDRGMSQPDPGYPVLRWIGIVICLMVFGYPAFGLFAWLTWGAILAPIIAAVVSAPFFLLHYLLWGRDFEHEVSEERSAVMGPGESENGHVD